MTTKINTSSQYVDEEQGLMIRTDKTVKQMMDEKPSSRWDPDYWHPKYDELLSLLSSKHNLHKLGEYLLEGTAGITYGQVGQRLYDKNGEIQYLQVSNILRSGVDIYTRYARVKKNSHNDPERSRLKIYDLLLLNGGVGSLGRSCLFLGENDKYNISQDIDRIRLSENIDPFFVTLFINCKFGRMQIERFQKGVSGQTKIGFDHVKYIRIPELDSNIIILMKKKYLEMNNIHNKALEKYRDGNISDYKKYLNEADNFMDHILNELEECIRN